MNVGQAEALGRLVDEWRRDPWVTQAVAELQADLSHSDDSFFGRPLPENLVRGRLPAGIASAWVFVLRADHCNPAHIHPNSTQYTTAIAGSGIGRFDNESVVLRTFDSARPVETIYAIQPGVAHAFETGNDGLVVISFHTVEAESLVEIEVESAKSRTYVSGER